VEHLKSDYQAPILAAELCTQLGDRDRAFHWLEEAYKSKDYDLLSVKVYPPLEPLHADPRFADLVRRLGLATP
jgi:uncharacterized protein HemY